MSANGERPEDNAPQSDRLTRGGREEPGLMLTKWRYWGVWRDERSAPGGELPPIKVHSRRGRQSTWENWNKAQAATLGGSSTSYPVVPGPG